VTTPLCLGHDIRVGAVLPVSLIDTGNPGNPKFSTTIEPTPTTAPANRPPVFDPFTDKTVDEGSLVGETFSATDPDFDFVTVAITGVPILFCSVDMPLPSIASLLCQPTLPAGVYTMTVTATDDGSPPASVSQTFTLTVLAPNQAPVFDEIKDILMVVEGDVLTRTLTASDPDGNALRFSASFLPDFCTLTQTGPNAAVLRCAPSVGDARSTIISVSVVDDGDPPLGDGQNFTLTVRPFLDAGGDKTAIQGDQVDLAPTASPGSTIDFDLDNDGSFETPGPAAVFDTTGLAVGDYTIVVRACATSVCTIANLVITVLPRNNPPVLDPIGELELSKGTVSEWTLSAADPDLLDVLVFSRRFDSTDLDPRPPADFCTVIDNGNRTATLRCSTVGDDVRYRQYEITVVVTDSGNPQLSDEQVVTVLVTLEILVLEPSDVTLEDGFAPLSASSPASGVQFRWDFNNDGVFDDAFGADVLFPLAGLVPGFYPIAVQGCFDVPDEEPICNEAETGVNVLPSEPGEPTYDGLESLVRDNVSSTPVRFMLLLALNLAQFLDGLGALTAAERALESFIRLVERFTPRFISPEAAEQMVQMAEALIDFILD
jgi:hypothetical protein